MTAAVATPNQGVHAVAGEQDGDGVPIDERDRLRNLHRGDSGPDPSARPPRAVRADAVGHVDAHRRRFEGHGERPATACPQHFSPTQPDLRPQAAYAADFLARTLADRDHHCDYPDGDWFDGGTPSTPSSPSRRPGRGHRGQRRPRYSSPTRQVERSTATTASTRRGTPVDRQGAPRHPRGRRGQHGHPAPHRPPDRQQHRWRGFSRAAAAADWRNSTCFAWRACLGTGGAARAIVAALAEQGVVVVLAGRDPAKAQRAARRDRPGRRAPRGRYRPLRRVDRFRLRRPRQAAST